MTSDCCKVSSWQTVKPHLEASQYLIPAYHKHRRHLYRDQIRVVNLVADSRDSPYISISLYHPGSSESSEEFGSKLYRTVYGCVLGHHIVPRDRSITYTRDTVAPSNSAPKVRWTLGVSEAAIKTKGHLVDEQDAMKKRNFPGGHYDETVGRLFSGSQSVDAGILAITQ